MRFMRAFALFGVLGFSLFAVGCSGHSGAVTPPIVSQDGGSPMAPPNDPLASSSSSIGTMSTASSTSLIGKVDYMTYYSSSHKFQIKTTSGSYYWIYAPSGTQWSYNGLTLKVGVWVTASGSWGDNTTLDATSVSLSAAQPTVATNSTSTSSPTVVGQVDYMTYYSSSHQFQVRTSGGTYYWIYAPSAQWTYNGLTLKVGVWVTASGAWSSSTTLKATTVSLSSSAPTSTASPTLVGQVDYMTYYSSSREFQVRSTSGAYYWVYAGTATQWTYNGQTLHVGVWASVNGTWKDSKTLNATSITLTSTQPTGTTTSSTSSTPAPTSGAPKHVQTAEYLWTSTESSTNPSVYAPYLTWAYTMYNKMAASQAAGIKTVLYTSPIMPNSNTYEYNSLNNSYPGARATTCTGTVIHTYNGAGLLSDPTKSAAAAYFQNVVGHYESVAKTSNPGSTKPWNLIFVDNDGPLYGASATPCNYSPTTWGTAQANALATTGQKFILNALSVADSNVPTYVQRLEGSAIEGGVFEECFMTSLWASEEDAQLQSIALLKSEGKPGGAGFWCYADNSSANASTVIPLRMYIYASFLLTYDPNYSVFQESFATPSTFKVMPETGFVPMSPVSVPTNVTGLKTSTGAYMQRYNSCYYRGSYLGHCEVIVNPSTTSSVAVPNPWGLRHSMALSGAGVLDGGTVSFGGSVPSTMGPKSGIILTP